MTLNFFIKDFQNYYKNRFKIMNIFLIILIIIFIIGFLFIWFHWYKYEDIEFNGKIYRQKVCIKCGKIK